MNLEFSDPSVGLLPSAQDPAPWLSRRMAPREPPSTDPCGRGSTEAHPPSFLHVSCCKSLPSARHTPQHQTVSLGQPSTPLLPASSDGIAGVHRCLAPPFHPTGGEPEAQPGVRTEIPGFCTLRPVLHSCTPQLPTFRQPSPQPLCHWGKGRCSCPFQLASSPLYPSIFLQPQ